MIVRSALLFSLVLGTAQAQTKWDMPTPYSDGEFHTRNVKAFVEEVQKVTQPIQPIIEVLTTPIPVITPAPGAWPSYWS